MEKMKAVSELRQIIEIKNTNSITTEESKSND